MALKSVKHIWNIPRNEFQYNMLPFSYSYIVVCPAKSVKAKERAGIELILRKRYIFRLNRQNRFVVYISRKKYETALLAN